MKLLVDTSQIVVKKYFKVRQRNRIKVNYEEWKKNNKEIIFARIGNVEIFVKKKTPYYKNIRG